jgi:hypothetical protein
VVVGNPDLAAVVDVDHLGYRCNLELIKMNMQEFATLKVGDKIDNPMVPKSRGEVSSVTSAGVKIRWDTSMLDWLYTVQSTAWMHWSKAVEDDETERRMTCPSCGAPVVNGIAGHLHGCVYGP